MTAEHRRPGGQQEDTDRAEPQQQDGTRRGLRGDPQGRSIYQALGGTRAVLDSGLPTVVFVPVFLLASLRPALWAALGAGAAIVVVRLLRREGVEHAVAGFVIVGAAAFFASRTGQAEDFFVPKLLIDAGYGLVWLVSTLVRWPILGLVLGPLLGEGLAWRRDSARLRAYSLASWFFVGLFAARLAVQVPLYLAGDAVALGVAHLAMSWPLFLAVVWMAWLVLRRTPLATPSGQPETPSYALASPRGSAGTRADGEGQGQGRGQPDENRAAS